DGLGVVGRRDLALIFAVAIERLIEQRARYEVREERFAALRAPRRAAARAAVIRKRQAELPREVRAQDVGQGGAIGLELQAIIGGLVEDVVIDVVEERREIWPRHVLIGREVEQAL